MRFLAVCGAYRLGNGVAVLSDRRIIELSGLFDEAWYRETYPDVTGDPLEHYLVHGWNEGRSPGPSFDAPWYLATNPDLASYRGNPLLHYLRHGIGEGRAKRKIQVTPQERLQKLWPLIKSDAKPLQDVANPLSPIPRLLTFWENRIVAAPAVQTGTVVQKILTHLPPNIDHLLVIPWLGISGGSEKVTERLLTFLRGRYEAGRLAALAPDAKFDLPPVRRLQYEIPIAAVNDFGPKLSLEDRAEIVDQVLINLRPRTVHVINSDAGWDALRQQAQEYARDSNIFVNIYSDIRWPDGGPAGYFWRYLPDVIPHVAGVFADNAAVVERAMENFSLLPEQRELFSVAPTPIVGMDGRNPASQCRPYLPGAGEHSLWMSRICWEKRLDIVRKIAQHLPQRRFSIYGAILPGVVPSDFLAWTEETENVEHLGAFSALEALPLETFDSYLFTTSAEGMPLSLLEATMLGLPTVAPAIGGIVEFIDNTTGWLVSRADAVDEFVAALEEISIHPAEAARRVSCAQQRLIERHSWKNYERVISTVPNYMVTDGQ
jgi:glycosyltransferase involved in cell wall biosynthesis